MSIMNRVIGLIKRAIGVFRSSPPPVVMQHEMPMSPPPRYKQRRRPGPRQPAGSKVARKAAQHKLGVKWP